MKMLDNGRPKKADDTLVPSELRDNMILSAFRDRPNFELVINLLRKKDLTLYGSNILRSFITWLRRVHPRECLECGLGRRNSLSRGEFCKYLEVRRDVISKVIKSISILELTIFSKGNARWFSYFYEVQELVNHYQKDGKV